MSDPVLFFAPTTRAPSGARAVFSVHVAGGNAGVSSGSTSLVLAPPSGAFLGLIGPGGLLIGNGVLPGQNGGLLIGNGADGGPGQNGGNGGAGEQGGPGGDGGDGGDGGPGGAGGAGGQGGDGSDSDGANGNNGADG